ncbi:MAG: hypothetical protein MUF81_02740 [Verrucomicrobia bacterium]|jgi:hypothetical protein|nr:hypothetical protein [Verrucomicrobiota bacterium]
MNTLERPDAPTLEVTIARPELLRHNRWNAGYFEERFRRNERKLIRLHSVPLGDFIPDELPDGSKGITYGQVGARKLSSRGGVRYLQVINIRDTGIDFSIKPDRIAEGSHNDPERSRVGAEDILFTNNAFRGTETLIGRCVALARDYGKLNISQHIDRIRVDGIDPFYVCCFLKSRFGALQVQRVMHGVDAMTISFGRIRNIEIPVLAVNLQFEVRRQYLAMAKQHDRAMTIKERLLDESGIDSGQYGEAINNLANTNPGYKRAMAEAQARLKHLISELEAVLEGEQKKIRPFAS